MIKSNPSAVLAKKKDGTVRIYYRKLYKQEEEIFSIGLKNLKEILIDKTTLNKIFHNTIVYNIEKGLRKRDDKTNT